MRVCTYCHKVVQKYTQSTADVTTVRNLEQLQADLSAFTTDPDVSASGGSSLTLPKPYPFDLDDEENFYVQPSLRKISNSSSMNAMSSYLEKFDQKEWPSPLSAGRRPFDAFGVCAAEADMLKQVSDNHDKLSPKASFCLIFTIVNFHLRSVKVNRLHFLWLSWCNKPTRTLEKHEQSQCPNILSGFITLGNP